MKAGWLKAVAREGPATLHRCLQASVNVDPQRIVPLITHSGPVIA
jgi:hypothetical protein